MEPVDPYEPPLNQTYTQCYCQEHRAQPSTVIQQEIKERQRCPMRQNGTEVPARTYKTPRTTPAQLMLQHSVESHRCQDHFDYMMGKAYLIACLGNQIAKQKIINQVITNRLQTSNSFQRRTSRRHRGTQSEVHA